jgi:hypothetical protein
VFKRFVLGWPGALVVVICATLAAFMNPGLLGRYGEVSPPTTSTTLLIPDADPTPASITETKTVIIEAEWLRRIRALGTITDVDMCAVIPHYHFIQPPQPEVLPNGATFSYDCKTHQWGWYHQGTPEDAWTPRSVDPGIPYGQPSVRLPLQALDPPSNRHHPIYSDALNLTDITPNMTVCARGASFVSPLEFQIGEMYTYVGRGSTELIAYPAFDMGGRVDGIGRALSDYGILPEPRGRWADSRVTAGPCT